MENAIKIVIMHMKISKYLKSMTVKDKEHNRARTIKTPSTYTDCQNCGKKHRKKEWPVVW